MVARSLAALPLTPPPSPAASTACVTIDKGIPIPPVKRDGRKGRYGKYRRYPWAAMDVGDSFAIPIAEDAVRAQGRMSGVLMDRRRRYPERFTVRVVEENGGRFIRVWRVS